MNPMMLFLLTFLAVCFFLILVQKDFSKWQKFSLCLNPALLALIILVLMAKTSDDVNCAADLASTVNPVSAILRSPDENLRKSAAERIRAFCKDAPQTADWRKFSADLISLMPEKKQTGKTGSDLSVQEKVPEKKK